MINKSNTIEIGFYILFGIFILTLISLIAFQELGILKTKGQICADSCLENNMTSKYRNEVCKCCSPSENINRKETIIEERCYEVIYANESI